MQPDRIGVHATHCCPIYGCKYGDEDCPVENKTVEPVYPCENCTCAKFNPEAAQKADAWWTTISEDMKASIYMAHINLTDSENEDD